MISTVGTIGSNGLDKGGYMKLSGFGALQIAVTPLEKNPELMSVDIGAQNRMEALHMETNKDETVDQFVTRIRSMLRSLHNGEPRNVPVTMAQAKKEEVKKKTWEEEKEELTAKTTSTTSTTAKK